MKFNFFSLVAFVLLLVSPLCWSSQFDSSDINFRLREMVKAGNVSEVKRLLQLGADPNFRSQVDKDPYVRRTPLMLARKYPDVVQALLDDARTNPALRDEQGIGLIYYLSDDSFDIAIQYPRVRSDIDWGDALVFAVWTRSRKKVEAIISEFGDVLNPNTVFPAQVYPGMDSFRWTALHIATYSEDLETVAKLLALDKTDPNVPERLGYTPLHLAARYGKLAIVRLLIKHPRVNVCARDNAQWTPERTAWKFKEIEAVIAAHPDASACED